MLPRLLLCFFASTLLLCTFNASSAQDAKKDDDTKKVEAETKKLVEKMNDPAIKADSAWMMISTALVLLMVPGLALFYGGMVRRKNILATMMHSMVALAIVGVYWLAIGYSLAFGKPIFVTDQGSFVGFSVELVFLKGVQPTDLLPGTNIPIYLHMLYQGMFAIITPALISGALAERIRFKPYCIFLLVWVTFVYCPLAHCVWAMDWWTGAADAGTNAIGFLGKMGALDFAGGTVVHIAAGVSGLAAILVLRKRLGYPEHPIHPNSMVLTLTGAGILWFGWFGFNGGSGLTSGAFATSAFAATQCAAAAGALSWLLVEWAHRGKPTALGLASGLVAGLVAVTPASGFVYPWGGFAIGLISGIVCYIAVTMKPVFKYDDSLDAFGVHGVGGFLGAVLTGVFCYKWNYLDPAAGADGMIATGGETKQLIIQLIAASVSAGFAFVLSLIMIKAIDIVFGFMVDETEEIEGLDRAEHGETGFDFGYGFDAAQSMEPIEPRAAVVPPGSTGKFALIVEGTANSELIHIWSDLCQPSLDPAPEFKAIYPFVTTVQGNRFQFRGGDQEAMKANLQKLFEKSLKKPLRIKAES